MVCYIGNFKLLKDCDRDSKPSLLIFVEEMLMVSLKMLTFFYALRLCLAISYFLFDKNVLILYNSHKQNREEENHFGKKRLIVMAKKTFIIGRIRLIRDILVHKTGP